MLFPKQTVKNISESVGISKLSDDVTDALANDVEYRIQQIIEEAIKFMQHSKRTKLTVNDINQALRVRNFEPLYGFDIDHEIKYHKAVSGYENLYYINEEELDLDAIINQPLPEAPLDTTYTAHWLAIEGVQPRIKQNPIDEAKEAEPEPKQRRDGEKLKVTKDKGAEVVPLVKHALSKELQLYYDCVTSALASDDPVVRATALESLSIDAGIHQLVPYFVQYIADKVTHNLHNLDVLQTAMAVARSILANPHIFVEPYLHQLMPALLTCLVGKTLCESPEEDHWSLRNKAAMMIAQICTEFGDSYHTLRTRITRTLLRAFLDLSKSLTTHYGAITGLSMLGADVIRVLIVPNIKEYMSLLDIELGKKSNTVLINEATRCKQALLDALARLGEDYKQQHYQQQQSESRQGQPKEPRQPSSEAKKQLTELIGVSFARELFKHPDFNYIAPAILQAEGTTAAAEKQQQQQQ